MSRALFPLPITRIFMMSGFNPQAGEKIKIAAQKVPKFVPGTAFKAAVDPKAAKRKAEKAAAKPVAKKVAAKKSAKK